MYIPLLTVARGHSPPHCENTQVLREAITEDDDDDDDLSIYLPILLNLLGGLQKEFRYNKC